MAVLTWGDLLKSQADGETIEQAIARIVIEHKADETAHLATGESLQSHKAAEIIDHLAQSIVQDKLSKSFFSPYLLHGSFQSLDAFRVSAYGIALSLDGVALWTNTSLNNLASISSAGNTDQDLIYNDDPILEIPVQIKIGGTYEAYFGLGDRAGWYDEYFCGFKVVDGALWARMYSVGIEIERLVSISGITVTNYNVYRIEYEHGVGAKFYVNGVYKATIAYADLDNENSAVLYTSIKTTQANMGAEILVWPFNLYYVLG